ncbi:hypothetical protein [Streptacidiphilus sp. EB129]|uniref:hypothetical protein n=1 Tax=Streptacidiphilus sp. EB129 TaxID=3156262 RepID=UPI0035153844
MAVGLVLIMLAIGGIAVLVFVGIMVAVSRSARAGAQRHPRPAYPVPGNLDWLPQDDLQQRQMLHGTWNAPGAQGGGHGHHPQHGHHGHHGPQSHQGHQGHHGAHDSGWNPGSSSPSSYDSGSSSSHHDSGGSSHHH